MTKADIVENLQNTLGFPRKTAMDFVEATFELIKEALKSGENVKLSGFGNFVLRNKRPRMGRNPQTGQEIEITARKVLTFRPSPLFKNALLAQRPEKPEPKAGGETAPSRPATPPG